MSLKDIALEGLERGTSIEGLKITRVRGKGLGVVTTKDILARSFVTDYKYGRIHYTRTDKQKAERDYISNEEGSYILEVFVGGKRIYLDATRRHRTIGR